MNKTFASLAGIFCTASGVTFSVWDLEEKILLKAPQLQAWLKYLPEFLLFVGGLFLLFTVFWVCAFWAGVFRKLRLFGRRNVSVCECQSTDIDEISRIANEHIVGSTDQRKSMVLYNHCPKSFRKIIDTKSNKIIGYICLLPLTNKGEKQIENRDVLVGNLDTTYFAKRFRKGCSVYIAGMVGEKWAAKGAAIDFIRDELKKIGALKAYSRPVTKDGVRLLKGEGFQPVSEHDRVEADVYVFKAR